MKPKPKAKKVPRVKERYLKKVLADIMTWRKTYYANKKLGYDKKKFKNSLNIAAQRIGYSKKSLDDYILHVRYGAKFGFDFKSFINSKFGVLRKFTTLRKK